MQDVQCDQPEARSVLPDPHQTQKLGVSSEPLAADRPVVQEPQALA